MIQLWSFNNKNFLCHQVGSRLFLIDNTTISDKSKHLCSSTFLLQTLLLLDGLAGEANQMEDISTSLVHSTIIYVTSSDGGSPLDAQLAGFSSPLTWFHLNKFHDMWNSITNVHVGFESSRVTHQPAKHNGTVQQSIHTEHQNITSLLVWNSPM